MRHIYKIFIITLILLLIISVGISITYSTLLDKFIIQSDVNITSIQKPDYHFSIILKNKEEQYWKGIKRGVEQASLEFLSAVEINFTEGEKEYEETLKYIDIAINSKMDGIVTKGYNSEEFINLVKKAQERGIPVVTIDTDSPLSKRKVFVGTNGFEIGSKAGKLLVDAFDNSESQVNVAFIQDIEKGENHNATQIDGFKDGVKGYNIEVQILENSNLDILGAKNIAQQIVLNKPEVNVIVCSDPNDTIGVAQVLVDYNKVGDIIIVGYDSLNEILNYVDKQVIYGTISPDPVMIGYESVRSLYDIKVDGRTSSYVHTDVDVVTVDNLELYINNITERMEKEEKNE